MKRLVLAILTVAALALPVCAQSRAVVGDVPFGFVAGNSTMPPGQYTVNFSYQPFVVVLVAPDLHAQLLIPITEDILSGSAQPAMVFHRYGDQYFLSEIRTWNRSRELPKSPMEREAEKTASAGRAGREIVVAMR